MIDPELLMQLRTLLPSCQAILCVSHVNPDGDAVGSLLGMGWLLRSLGKAPTLALQDPVPEQFHSLPGVASILTAQDAAYGALVTGKAFDLVVCLDASSPDRMGTAYHPAVHATAPLLVIDHHVTNTRFGALNWVAPECAATCQMLVALADALHVPLATEIARCLLTGLVTDTLGFRTGNTTADVLEAAMRLIRAGADLADITEQTLNRRPFSAIRLWGLVLPAVQLDEHIIWTTISREQMAVAQHDGSDLQLSSWLITASEADISAVFLEKVDEQGRPAVECSFRAKPGFDVSGLAYALGGGGHPPASGCTLPGALDAVTAQVLPALKQVRSGQAEQRAQATRVNT